MLHRFSLQSLRLSILFGAALVLCSGLIASPLYAADLAVGASSKATAKKVNKIKSIKGVKSFVILSKKKKKKPVGGRGVSAQGVTDVKTLFSLDNSGVLKEVKYLDKQGKTYQFQSEPIAVHNINDTYVMTVYGPSGSSATEAYLLRKTDGKLFPLGRAGMPVSKPSNYKNDLAVQTDVFGNIYYATQRCDSNCRNGLVRVDVSNPTKIRAEQLIPSDEHMESWSIDPNGNVVYKTVVWSTYQNFFRARNRSGALRSVGSSTYAPYWVGLDGAFYWTSYDNVTTKQIFQRLEIDASGGFNSSVYSESPMTTGVPAGSTGFLFRFADRIVAVSSPMPLRTEVYNPEKTPRVLSNLDLSNVSAGAQSPDRYYIAGADARGDGVLLRINPFTDEAAHLVAPGTYSFYSIAVGSDNSVIYSALRMSDGNKVVGEISPTGVDTVVSVSVEEAIDIEPIN